MVESASTDTRPPWQLERRDEDDDCDEDRGGRSEGESCDARGGKFFTGDWLEDRRGRRYAVMGQNLSLDGTRGGNFAIGARVAQNGTVPCVGARGRDTAAVPAGIEITGSCTYEILNSETNRTGLAMVNVSTLNVCTSSNPNPDGAVLDHADVTRGIYCYRGQGAGLNDRFGAERDGLGIYYPESQRCHLVFSGGIETIAAKRPSTKTFPVPQVIETTRIRWLVVNNAVTIANP